jgi:acetolactate synthase-1/2/3 large subunit
MPASCGEVLIRLLHDHGVNTVFGIPGVHTVELYRGLAHSSIHHYTPRHEQGAGFMADGYARVSGEPGVCFLITGPGVTNAATALAEAYSDSVPVLAISSVNQTRELGTGTGRLHELPSQHNLASQFTVFSHTVLDPAELPHVLARAFTVFGSERPGPVHIEIPIDVLVAEGVSGKPMVREIARPGPDPDAISEAVKLLREASQPVAIFGGGALDASTEAMAVVERFQIPAVLTVAGKGVIAASHALCLGASLPFAPVLELIRDADVILAVGTEFAETDLLYTGADLEITGRMIRIDVEAQQLVRNFAPEIPILSDAKLALRALVDEAGMGEVNDARGREGTRGGEKRVSEIRSVITSCYPASAAKHLRILDLLASQLDDETVMVSDSTQLAYTACHAYPTQHPRRFMFPLGFGALGYALPAAIGAKIARPELPVVCVVGDGGLLFTLEEMAAAMEFGTPVVMLVWNNRGYGEIRDAMVASGVVPIGVDLEPPDFVALAKSFGWEAHRATSLSRLSRTLATSLESREPSLIEIDASGDFTS